MTLCQLPLQWNSWFGGFNETNKDHSFFMMGCGRFGLFCAIKKSARNILISTIKLKLCGSAQLDGWGPTINVLLFICIQQFFFFFLGCIQKFNKIRDVLNPAVSPHDEVWSIPSGLSQMDRRSNHLLRLNFNTWTVNYVSRFVSNASPKSAWHADVPDWVWFFRPIWIRKSL